MDEAKKLQKRVYQLEMEIHKQIWDTRQQVVVPGTGMDLVGTGSGRNTRATKLGGHGTDSAADQQAEGQRDYCLPQPDQGPPHHSSSSGDTPQGLQPPSGGNDPPHESNDPPDSEENCDHCTYKTALLRDTKHHYVCIHNDMAEQRQDVLNLQDDHKRMKEGLDRMGLQMDRMKQEGKEVFKWVEQIQGDFLWVREQVELLQGSLQGQQLALSTMTNELTTAQGSSLTDHRATTNTSMDKRQGTPTSLCTSL
mmetsp:Transcript_23400/g.58720  ORF Transcript_23400/g.58720 Transcript_23400/m.58720 type:complete len:252 (+) Transcript_23400:1397-2152(+)